MQPWLWPSTPPLFAMYNLEFGKEYGTTRLIKEVRREKKGRKILKIYLVQCTKCNTIYEIERSSLVRRIRNERRNCNHCSQREYKRRAGSNTVDSRTYTGSFYRKWLAMSPDESYADIGFHADLHNMFLRGAA